MSHPPPPPWQVVPFNSKAQDRKGFSCGVPDLDRYLRDYAAQDIKRDVARVFVALNGDGPGIAGYYSLSATSVQRETLPVAQQKRLPRYPVPAALLGRLAVDSGMKGRGLGAFLLMDALNRLLLATQALAIHAVIVDAKDQAAVAFYRKYGFIPFSNEGEDRGEGKRLLLPMATLRQVAGSIDVAPPRYTLDELLEGITPDTCHPKDDPGPSMGREEW